MQRCIFRKRKFSGRMPIVPAVRRHEHGRTDAAAWIRRMLQTDSPDLDWLSGAKVAANVGDEFRERPEPFAAPSGIPIIEDVRSFKSGRVPARADNRIGCD